MGRGRGTDVERHLHTSPTDQSVSRPIVLLAAAPAYRQTLPGRPRPRGEEAPGVKPKTVKVPRDATSEPVLLSVIMISTPECIDELHLLKECWVLVRIIKARGKVRQFLELVSRARRLQTVTDVQDMTV